MSKLNNLRQTEQIVRRARERGEMFWWERREILKQLRKQKIDLAALRTTQEELDCLSRRHGPYPESQLPCRPEQYDAGHLSFLLGIVEGAEIDLEEPLHLRCEKLVQRYHLQQARAVLDRGRLKGYLYIHDAHAIRRHVEWVGMRLDAIGTSENELSDLIGGRYRHLALQCRARIDRAIEKDRTPSANDVFWIFAYDALSKRSWRVDWNNASAWSWRYGHE